MRTSTCFSTISNIYSHRSSVLIECTHAYNTYMHTHIDYLLGSDSIKGKRHFDEPKRSRAVRGLQRPGIGCLACVFMYVYVCMYAWVYVWSDALSDHAFCMSLTRVCIRLLLVTSIMCTQCEYSCMCIIYIYIYIHTYAHIYTYKCTNVYTYILYIYIYIYIYIHTYVCTSIMYLHTCYAHTHIHVSVPSIHTCDGSIHTYMYGSRPGQARPGHTLTDQQQIHISTQTRAYNMVLSLTSPSAHAVHVKPSP